MRCGFEETTGDKSLGQEPERSADLQTQHTPRQPADHTGVAEAPIYKMATTGIPTSHGHCEDCTHKAHQAPQKDAWHTHGALRAAVPRFLPTHNRGHLGGCAVSCSTPTPPTLGNGPDSPCSQPCGSSRVKSTTAPESPYHPGHSAWFRDGHRTQSEPMRFEDRFP